VAAFVGAGALAGNATVTPQAISSHASTIVGDILFCQLINKSATANVVTPPDATWTKVIEASNSAATGPHQYTLFWKRASLAGAQSYTFTKATDDNVLFAGVISTWRASGLDPTTRGVTATTSAADNVSFPAFDPVGVAHVIYFAWYGLSATTFGVMAGTNPTCTNRYDLESATGTTCTLSATSGDSDPSAIGSRTWASASTTDAGNTGVVIALSDAPVAPAPPPPLFRRMVAQAGGVTGPIVIPAPGSDDVRYSSTKTGLNVRRTLLYRPLTTSLRVVTTETVPVTAATVTVFGKPITEYGFDVTAVTPATVTFAGQTVTLSEPISDLIPQAETDLLARWTLLYRSLTEPVPFPSAADIVTVTPAAITITGQTVAIGEGTPPGNNDVRFATAQTAQTARRGLLYRSLIVPPKVDVAVPEFVYASRASMRVIRRALLYQSLTGAPLVTPPGVEIIPVFPGGIRFTGQEVTLTGQGEAGLPIGGGGGVTVPPWIDYGRKQRRRYRALEEIERRLDKRIETLKAEKAKLDGPQGQQVGVQLAAPDLAQFLLNFEQLLNRQAAINAALLEAQRRAEAVRQERIQLAILAQRAAEAIDEEEAITMLLLT
jgi:hypothetical protein